MPEYKDILQYERERRRALQQVEWENDPLEQANRRNGCLGLLLLGGAFTLISWLHDEISKIIGSTAATWLLWIVGVGVVVLVSWAIISAKITSAIEQRKFEEEQEALALAGAQRAKQIIREMNSGLPGPVQKHWDNALSRVAEDPDLMDLNDAIQMALEQWGGWTIVALDNQKQRRFLEDDVRKVFGIIRGSEIADRAFDKIIFDPDD